MSSSSFSTHLIELFYSYYQETGMCYDCLHTLSSFQTNLQEGRDVIRNQLIVYCVRYPYIAIVRCLILFHSLLIP